jgi:hypothetical protein
MPARRFWMMERQIDRIRAENEIRNIQNGLLITPPQSNEHLKRVTERIEALTLEIGEKVTVRRNIIVAPEPGAAAKFAKLTGG